MRAAINTCKNGRPVWRAKIDVGRRTSPRSSAFPMKPQPSLSSTGCLAQTPTEARSIWYAPNGGTFTVNLSAMPSSRALNVEWFDPSTGTTSSTGAAGAGATRSFSTPFSGDVVLYLVDAAGHNRISSSDYQAVFLL